MLQKTCNSCRFYRPFHNNAELGHCFGEPPKLLPKLLTRDHDVKILSHVSLRPEVYHDDSACRLYMDRPLS